MNTTPSIPQPSPTRAIFNNEKLAPLWLLLRLLLGGIWLMSGVGKLTDPQGQWVGSNAGMAVQNFVDHVLSAPRTGAFPDVLAFYADFLRLVVQPHPVFFSGVVTAGEILVGLALIAGAFTAVAAFWASVMNLAFMLAGVVFINPIMFILATWLVLAWRTSGAWGLDHWLLRWLGVPGAPGTAFRHVRA